MFLDHKQEKILTSFDQIMNEVLNLQQWFHSFFFFINDFIVHITKYIIEGHCWYDLL